MHVFALPSSVFHDSLFHSAQKYWETQHWFSNTIRILVYVNILVNVLEGKERLAF